ncbi:MAG: hypothetical protein ACX931_04180 [Saccharospirillum sp.]
MNDNRKTELLRATDWLSEEVQIRVSRKMLVVASLALLVLLGIALD